MNQFLIVCLLLFLAGCPVFAQEASIYPFDTVAAHFPKDERFDHVGRLDEELLRTSETYREIYRSQMKGSEGGEAV